MAGAFGGEDDMYSSHESGGEDPGFSLDMGQGSDGDDVDPGFDLDPEQDSEGNGESEDSEESSEEGSGEEGEESEEDPDDEPDYGEEGADEEGDPNDPNVFKKMQAKFWTSVYKPQVPAMLLAIKLSRRKVFNKYEQNMMKRCKQFNILKAERTKMRAAINTNVTISLARKAATAAPAGTIAGYMAIAFMAVLLVVTLVMSVVLIANPDMFKKEFPGVEPTSQVMDTRDFYGVRTIYYDELEARSDIISDGDRVITDIINEAFETVAPSGEATVGALQYTELKFTPTDDPEAPFDFSRFASDDTEAVEEAEDTLKTDTARYNAIRAVLASTYKADNASEAGVGMTLSAMADSIKYFGLSIVDNRDTIREEIIRYIVANTTFNVDDGGTARTNLDYPEPELMTMMEDLFGASIDTGLDNVATERTEKLYIKDVIVNDKSEMGAIVEHDYKFAIIMPKRNLTLDTLSISVVNPRSDFTSTLEYEGKSVKWTQDSTTTIYYEPTDTDPGYATLDLGTGKGANLSTSAYSIGDDVEYLAEGKSLIEIIRDGKTDTYLVDNSGVHDVAVSGLVWTPTNGEGENREPFSFVIFEVEVD